METVASIATEIVLAWVAVFIAIVGYWSLYLVMVLVIVLYGKFGGK